MRSSTLLTFRSGVMSKAPAPSSSRGGSSGEPSESCAAAGRAARAAITPSAASIARVVIVENLTAPPKPLRGAYYGRSAARQAKPRRAAPLCALQAFARQHQLLADPRLHRRMPRIRDDDVVRLGPGARQFVGAADRADHVITALHNRRRQGADAVDARHQIVGAGKQMVCEKMRLDPRQAERQT